MVTTFDKFIVAVLGAVLYALNEWFGVSLGFSDEAFQSIAVALSAVLVYFVPNKEPI